MIWLSSCEEIIIEKYVIDTLYIDRPPQGLAPTIITVTDTVFLRDTISVTIVVRDTILQEVHSVDTVYKVVTRDSLI